MPSLSRIASRRWTAGFVASVTLAVAFSPTATAQWDTQHVATLQNAPPASLPLQSTVWHAHVQHKATDGVEALQGKKLRSGGKGYDGVPRGTQETLLGRGNQDRRWLSTNNSDTAVYPMGQADFPWVISFGGKNPSTSSRPCRPIVRYTGQEESLASR